MAHLYVDPTTWRAAAFAPVPIPVGIGSKTGIFSSQARLGTDKKTARIFEVRAVFLSPPEPASADEFLRWMSSARREVQNLFGPLVEAFSRKFGG